MRPSFCYNEQAPILCTAGLRALLEGICQDKRIKGRNLKAKIDGLKAILPSRNIIRNLHHFRFMGNDAVHELAAPKPNELALAIGVIEDLLNFLYEMDYKASQLRELRRSNRPKKSKPAKAAIEAPTVAPQPLRVARAAFRSALENSILVNPTHSPSAAIRTEPTGVEQNPLNA